MSEYNYNKFISSLKSEEIKVIKYELIKSINYYIIDFENIYSSTVQILNDQYINKVIIIDYFNNLINYLDSNTFKNNILKHLFINKCEFVLSYELFFDKNNTKILDNIFELVSKEFERLTFKYYLNINVDTLNINNNDLISLIETGLPKDKSELFMFNDKKFVNTNKEVIDLKELFVLENYFPNTKTIIKYISKIIKENKNNYIYLPLYLMGKSKIFDTNNHGYFKIFYQYKDYYTNLITSIGESFSNYEITFVISNVMNYDVFIKWEVVIKKINPRFKVGLVIEDFEFLQNGIETINIDTVIINLDYINNNNFYKKPINQIYFKKYYLDNLRNLKALINLDKEELIIVTNIDNLTEIIEKLVIMGFKIFTFKEKDLEKLENSMEFYNSRRGKYIKSAIL